MKQLIYAMMFAAAVVSAASFAADAPKKNVKVKYRKTQEVNFDGADVDGVVRSPDGAYLVQKRGVKFAPLYKVDQEMEKGVLESVNYLK